MRELRLLDLREICETEEHKADDVCSLAESILNLGFWTIPIAVEYSTFAIMDGHHRFNAAKKMGLKRVPCVLMDYKKSGVTLQSWRPEIGVSVTDIFFMISESKKYPLKTTRHIFDPPVDEVKIPIAMLL